MPPSRVRKVALAAARIEIDRLLRLKASRSTGVRQQFLLTQKSVKAALAAFGIHRCPDIEARVAEVGRKSPTAEQVNFFCRLCRFRLALVEEAHYLNPEYSLPAVPRKRV